MRCVILIKKSNHGDVVKKMYFVKPIVEAFLVFTSIALLCSNSALASSAKKNILIASCSDINGLSIKAYYTKRVSKDGRHLVKVDLESEGQHTVQDWSVVGWQKNENGLATLVIANHFGLALVDGKTESSSFIAPVEPGESPDTLHCDNNLAPVLKDFPLP